MALRALIAWSLLKPSAITIAMSSSLGAERLGSGFGNSNGAAKSGEGEGGEGEWRRVGEVREAREGKESGGGEGGEGEWGR